MDHASEPIGKVTGFSEDEFGLQAKVNFDWQQVAVAFDVPPWLVNRNYPAPRFSRLRWKLRRIWPLKQRDVPPEPSYIAEMERTMQESITRMIWNGLG